MGWKKLLIFGLICCFLSCKNYYYNKEGGERPKKSKFKLGKLPYQLKKGDKIDTNSIYIDTYTLNYGGVAHTDNAYIRFFSNGRYLEGLENSDVPLNSEKLNTINDTSMIGYYKLNSTNYLDLEYFSVKKGEGGAYYKSEGYIKNDSIFIFYSLYENKAFPKPTKENCRIYIRKKIEGLSGTPDW